MTYNTPLPISGRDPDSVPLKERVAELEEAKRDPVKAIRAQRGAAAYTSCRLILRPRTAGAFRLRSRGRPSILSPGARGWLLSAAAFSPGETGKGRPGAAILGSVGE